MVNRIFAYFRILMSPTSYYYTYQIYYIMNLKLNNSLLYNNILTTYQFTVKTFIKVLLLKTLHKK